MNSIVARILTEILGATRYKWHGMAIAWLVCVAGWIGVSLIPNNYESRAVLYIDTASMLRPLLADLAVNTNVMSEVRMMSEVLRSRPQIERVVRDTDLDLRANNAADMEKLISGVRDRIRVSASGGRAAFNEQNMYTISFTDKNPETVYAVVQSLLDSFVEISLGQNKADSAGAKEFIQEQIDQYETRLADAEQKLAEFKRKNVGLMPAEGADYYQRLQTANDELDKLKEQEATILTRRQELQKQIDGEEPTFGLLTPPDKGSFEELQGSDAGLEALQKELDTLLLKYTEKHPKVIALENRIAQLKRQQLEANGGTAAELEAERDTDLAGMNSLELNPVYQSFKIAMGEADAQLSEVREKIATSQSRVDYLRKMVDKVPEIEAQLARLNRDYEVNQAQHTALLKRLESARLSERAESQAEDVKFRVIEPPVVPLHPIGPDRVLFATVVLLAGLGAGGVLAFGLSLLNPVFNSVHDVRDALQLPVLGSISIFESHEQKRRHQSSRRRFAAVAVALLAAYALTTMAWPIAEMIRKTIVDGGLA